MIALYYVIAALCAAGVFLCAYLNRSASPSRRAGVDKLLAIALMVLFAVRELGGKYPIESTLGLNVLSPFGPQGGASVFFSTLLLWMIAAAFLLLVSYPFFREHVPILTPLVRFASTGVYALAFAFFAMLARAVDGELASGFHWRTLIFALEIGLALGLSVTHLWRERAVPTGWRGWGKCALVLLGMLVISMPPWAPQAIVGLGEASIEISGFNFYHRLVIYGSLLFVVPIHFLFCRCEYETRRYALLYISTAAMIAYCHQYSFANFLDMSTWPLHLCNTAMFIVPLVLMFRMERLYYFTIFINVFGAFLAMIMPNIEGTNYLATASVEFWLNHYCAMMLPIVLMTLKIFPRPKMKQFLYSLLAFGVYYVAILFINAYLTGLGKSVDFFFINSDFVAAKLGDWAVDLRDITVTFPINGVALTIYPLYQSIYFTVYIALSFAMWFLYEQAFEVTDIYAIISERNRKIRADQLALEVHLAGRSMKEPKNPENEGKLILRHFSKRYSTSDVYAVYDANLEIEGGQIFGFLGPNGAGKSTIIKSIVGIQTISGGEIEISGYDAEQQSVEAKMQVGFVPDHYALYENLTGREYVNYIADLYEVPRAERDARIKEYVDRFVLGQAFDNPIKTYSHGMKQKITIMSALVHNPKVWILDEPLTGLDPESIFQVKECMKEHAAAGNIVFFSSHIIDVVERICDKIAIIRKGQILCSRTVEEIEATGVALEDFYMSMIDGNTQSAVPTTVEMPTVEAV